MYFVPKVSLVANHDKFHQREQKPGEPTRQHIAALRNLIFSCDFGNMADELITDQLNEKTNMLHIKERFWNQIFYWEKS